jgi:predicted O-methyltransferase YrrM
MNSREIAVVVRNMILGGNLESLRTIRDLRQTASYVTECRFMHKLFFPNGGLVQKPVWEAFDIERVPVVLDADAAKEWFRPVASFTADLVSMCMLCQILKPKVVLEIGTFHGSGALHWAANSPEAEVYTLDLPPETVPSLSLTKTDSMHISEHRATTQMAFHGKPEADRIHCLYGDSATFDFSSFTGKVDLLFIDGAHSYEYVRNDTLRAAACCKPGGVIAWHDYGRAGFNGVSKWLHEYARQGRKIYRVPGGSLAYTQVSAT